MLLGFGNSTSVFEGKAFHGLIERQYYALDEMVHDALYIGHVLKVWIINSCGEALW